MRTIPNKYLFVILIVLVVMTEIAGQTVDKQHDIILEKSDDIVGGEKNELFVQLPSQFLVASYAGFREVIAGLLWVRADEFFHQGDFKAIVPIVRLVTWLDPHNIDVFMVGAWHLDYNFVDKNHISDKRYVPSAIALLKECIVKNPKRWEPYFELGWTHYNRKLYDYQKGLEYMELACTLNAYDPNTGEEKLRPNYVDRMLAHQYERAGELEKSVEQWKKARERAEKLLADFDPRVDPYIDMGSLDIIDRNLHLLYIRMAYRYGDMEAYKAAVEMGNEILARKGSLPMPADYLVKTREDYERRVRENDIPGDALKPLDTEFEVEMRPIAPRKIKISGKLGLVRAEEYKDLAVELITGWYQKNQSLPADERQAWRDGCRVFWVLHDLDYELPKAETFNWRVDTEHTVQWDSMYVMGGSFSDIIDLTGPIGKEFYPLKADKYKLTVIFIPQEYGCPDYTQDRIGWRGEAMVNPEYIYHKGINEVELGPGYKTLKTEMILTREQILGGKMSI